MMHLTHLTLLLGALTPTYAQSFNPLKHLAGISPYYPVHDPPLDSSPPQGCNVTGAAYLIRHSAIYANDFDYETYLEPFVQKLRNTTQNWSQTEDLRFLSNWTAPVNDEHLEKVTQVGYQQARGLGADIRRRYSGLGAPERIWASSADRTVKSADGFVVGYTRNQTQEITLVEVESDKDAGANTLTPHKSCPAYSGSFGSEQSSEFVNRYTQPIISRLNAQAPSFNFTVTDIVSMFEFCGYETVIRGSSSFCSSNLFTPDDWLAFEYGEDIRYFHNMGYSQEFTPRVGFPWINASVAALGNSSSQDLLVSFTHREVPPAVITALGLFNNTEFTGSNDVNATMPTDRINHHRAWRSSSILPFLTNIAIERMECDSYGYDEGEYYRVLVNSGPQPLGQCRDGPGESCSSDQFESFIEGLSEKYGDFNEACGVDGDTPQSLSIYRS